MFNPATTDFFRCERCNTFVPLFANEAIAAFKANVPLSHTCKDGFLGRLRDIVDEVEVEKVNH